jgi:hypothetical protein
MERRHVVAAGSGLLVVLGPPVGTDPSTRATSALHRIGYSTVSATLCTRVVPREWVCLVGGSEPGDRLGWIYFHRAADGSFVVRVRRAGQLVP